MGQDADGGAHDATRHQGAPASISIEEFRRRFPLGATSRVVLVDEAAHYAGIVQTPGAYSEGVDLAKPVRSHAINREAALAPELDIAAMMTRFDASGADELAVLDPERRVLGILSESFAAALC